MNPKKILIVKTSSLGDIFQVFPVSTYLASEFPHASLHWVVEKRFASFLTSHPLVEKVICIDGKNKTPKSLFEFFKELRKEKYDVVFDLQGNCKSGLITLFARSKNKVGFSRRDVAEWPNILATRKRFSIRPSSNMRDQYLSMIQQFFKKPFSSENRPVELRVLDSEKQRVDEILSSSVLQNFPRIMVCPGSKWKSKQLKKQSLITLLKNIDKTLASSFLFIGGSFEEILLCEEMCQLFLKRSQVCKELSIPEWQYLMRKVDLVIAMDSSALHLCGTTSTPSFGIFGPTMASIFQPTGLHHEVFQATCPYGQMFNKRCSFLRTCSTSACMDIDGDLLFRRFLSWYFQISSKDSKNLSCFK